MSDVRLNLKPLQRFMSVVKNQSGKIKQAVFAWGMIYRGFVQERFDEYSKGGGDWASLKLTTIKRRRKGLKALKGILFSGAQILRDTGIMFAALNPVFTNLPGALQKKLPLGIRVGFGGPRKHPGGKATIADIAGFHQTGARHLPKREIIVDPNQRTYDTMTEVMEAAMEGSYE